MGVTAAVGNGVAVGPGVALAVGAGAGVTVGCGVGAVVAVDSGMACRRRRGRRRRSAGGRRSRRVRRPSSGPGPRRRRGRRHRGPRRRPRNRLWPVPVVGRKGDCGRRERHLFLPGRRGDGDVAGGQRRQHQRVRLALAPRYADGVGGDADPRVVVDNVHRAPAGKARSHRGGRPPESQTPHALRFRLAGPALR